MTGEKRKFNPPVWRPGLAPEEERDIAYFERNMLALFIARNTGGGWYRDPAASEGFSRVISCMNGSATFHVPDDFDLGDLPEIMPNWDGHTTRQKWLRMAYVLGLIPWENVE